MGGACSGDNSRKDAYATSSPNAGDGAVATKGGGGTNSPQMDRRSSFKRGSSARGGLGTQEESAAPPTGGTHTAPSSVAVSPMHTGIAAEHPHVPVLKVRGSPGGPKAFAAPLHVHTGDDGVLNSSHSAPQTTTHHHNHVSLGAPLMSLPAASVGGGFVTPIFDGATPVYGNVGQGGGGVFGHGGGGGGGGAPHVLPTSSSCGSSPAPPLPQVSPPAPSLASDPALLPFVRPPPATVPLGWAEPSGLDEEEENKLKEQTIESSLFSNILTPEHRATLLGSCRLHRAPLGARLFSQLAEPASWVYVVARGLVRLEVFGENVEGNYAVGMGGSGGYMALDDAGGEDGQAPPSQQQQQYPYCEETELLGTDPLHTEEVLHDFLLGSNNLGTFLSPKHGQLTRAEAQATEAAAAAAAAAKAEKAAREAHAARKANLAAQKERDRSDRLKTSTDQAYRAQAQVILANMVAGGAVPGVAPIPAPLRPNAAKEKEIREREKKDKDAAAAKQQQQQQQERSAARMGTDDMESSLRRGPESPSMGGGGAFTGRHGASGHVRVISGSFNLPPSGVTPIQVPPSPSQDGQGHGPLTGGRGSPHALHHLDTNRSTTSNAGGGPGASTSLRSPTEAAARRAARRRSRGGTDGYGSQDMENGGVLNVNRLAALEKDGYSGATSGRSRGPSPKAFNRHGYGSSFGGASSGAVTPAASPRGGGFFGGPPDHTTHSSPRTPSASAEHDLIPDGPGTVRVCIKQPGQVFGHCGFMGAQGTVGAGLYHSSAMVHVRDTLVLCVPRSVVEPLMSASPRVRNHLTGSVLGAVCAAPWLRSLSPPQQVLLASLFSHGEVPARNALMVSGECTVDSSPIYLLVEGAVEVTLTDDRGRPQRKRIEAGGGVSGSLLPPRFLGELGAVMGLCRTASVTTLTPCVVRVLQRRWLSLFYRTAAGARLAQKACTALRELYPLKDELLLEQMDIQSAFGVFSLNSFSAENIEFWQTAIRFRKVIAPPIIRPPSLPPGSLETGALPSCVQPGSPSFVLASPFSRQDVLTEAALLYTRYISERSLVQINLKEGVRAAVLSALRSGVLRPDTFQRAEAEILHLMLHDNWSRFKASKGFAAALLDLEPPEPQPILLLPRAGPGEATLRQVAVASDKPWMHPSATVAGNKTTTNGFTASPASGNSASLSTSSPSPSPSVPNGSLGSPGGGGGGSPLAPLLPASLEVEFRWGAPVGRQMGEMLFTPDGEVRCADNDPPPTMAVVVVPAAQQVVTPVAQGGGSGGTANTARESGPGGNKISHQRTSSLPPVEDSPFVGAAPLILLHTPQGSSLDAGASGGSGGGGGGGGRASSDGDKSSNWLLQNPGESLVGGLSPKKGAMRLEVEGGGGMASTPSSPKTAIATSKEAGGDALTGPPTLAEGETVDGTHSAATTPRPLGSPSTPGRTPVDGLGTPLPPSPHPRTPNADGSTTPGGGGGSGNGTGAPSAAGSRRSTLSHDPANRPPLGHNRPPMFGSRTGSTATEARPSRRVSRASPFGAAAGGVPRNPIDAHNAMIAEAVFAQSVLAGLQLQSGGQPPSPLLHAAVGGYISGDGHASDRAGGGGGGGGGDLSPERPVHVVRDGRRHTPTTMGLPSSMSTMASIGLTVKRTHGVHQRLKASPFNVPQPRNRKV